MSKKSFQSDGMTNSTRFVYPLAPTKFLKINPAAERELRKYADCKEEKGFTALGFYTIRGKWRIYEFEHFIRFPNMHSKKRAITRIPGRSVPKRKKSPQN